MWQILMWILVLALVAGIAMRLWKEAGGKVGNKSVSSFLKNGKAQHIKEVVTMREIGLIFGEAIFFRIMVYIISIVIMLIIKSDDTVFTLQSFLEGFNRWDGPHYLSIAEFGYSGSIENGKALFVVFFPLYPYMIRLVNLVVHNYIASALIISCITYGIGCCYLFKLVALDYGKKVAKNTIILMSIFPFSFFFGSVMSESLFFMLSVMVLYYARKHVWCLTGIIGIFACMTRIHGILLAVPVCIEWAIYYRPLKMIRKKKYNYLRNVIFKKALWIPLMSLGIVYYLWMNYSVTGNPFQFTIYQREHWSMAPCLFTDTLKYVFHNAFFSGQLDSLQMCMWIPTALLFIVGMGTMIYGFRRYRVSYIAHFFVYMLLNYSVTWLISGPRYMSCAIPMFLIIGEFATRHEKVKRWLMISFSMLFSIYLAGYIMWKHIL